MDKRNYFFRYPMEKQFYRDALNRDSYVATATSGSTGTPAYFFRTDEVDRRYAQIASWFLSLGPKGSTLLIDCFGMGVWIGGLITYQAFRYAGLSGFPVSIIAPGVNKKEIFEVLRRLAPQFRSVILAGYPPFLKDILDGAKSEKVFFRPGQLRLVFAAEGFSEEFRNYMVEAGRLRSPYLDTMNIYGSAELGAMAFETPYTILVRRLAKTASEVLDRLFLPKRLPTLAQYDPRHIVFESLEGKILITGDSAMPFFRYKIGDVGSTMTSSEIGDVFEEAGIKLNRKLSAAGIPKTHLPLVAVYEREDFSTKLYGAIVYPAHIRDALSARALREAITGKFAMRTGFDRWQNQFLEILVELKPGKNPARILKKRVTGEIVDGLLRQNAEYRNNYQSIPRKVTPRVTLLPHGDERYFRTGIKQKWVIK